MRSIRTAVVTPVVLMMAMTLGLAGCGSTDEPVTRSDVADTTSGAGDGVATTAPEAVGNTAPATIGAGPSTAFDLATIPAVAAPGALAGIALPSDADAVRALLGALPEELLGGELSVLDGRPGVIGAEYAVPGRVTPPGVQAIDLAASYYVGFIPEPTAEYLVALLASGADWEVETAGRDGGLYWVLWNTTGGGDGMQEELIESLTFGDAGSPWAFVIGAPSVAARDEVLAAFADAAAATSELAR